MLFRNFDPELNKENKGPKQEKVIKTLSLNQKYMKVTNRLLEACVNNYEYVKSINYVNNLLFIYNNTIKMIHEGDPWYYPTKKPNEIILMNEQIYIKNVESKIFF